MWIGPWSAGRGYVVDEAVSYNGSSYVAVLAGTNRPPDTSPTYWQLLASKGDIGPQGPAGSAGAALNIAAAQWIVPTAGWHYGSPRWGSPSSAAITVGSVALSPVSVMYDVTLTHILYNVATAAVGVNVRTGIYRHSSIGPKELVFDFGPNAATPTGVKDITLPINMVLPAGNYWLTIQVGGSGSVAFQGYGLTLQPGLLGSNNPVGPTCGGIMANIGATVSSPLPDPFPPGASYVNPSTMPIVQFQVATS